MAPFSRSLVFFPPDCLSVSIGNKSQRIYNIASFTIFSSLHSYLECCIRVEFVWISLLILGFTGNEEQPEKPHFDCRSVIFELDSCNGNGKVCLVYKHGKPGKDHFQSMILQYGCGHHWTCLSAISEQKTLWDASRSLLCAKTQPLLSSLNISY